MLTQNQINNLELLSNHPKYGSILRDALNTWKREDVNPGYNGFGIDTSDFEVYVVSSKQTCCLLGAALIGQKRLQGFVETLEFLYKISYEEFRSLWHGFDKLDDKKSCLKEAYEFGESARNALGI